MLERQLGVELSEGEKKHTRFGGRLQLLAEALYHGKWEGVNLLPNIEQLGDFVLQNTKDCKWDVSQSNSERVVVCGLRADACKSVGVLNISLSLCARFIFFPCVQNKTEGAKDGRCSACSIPKLAKATC